MFIDPLDGLGDLNAGIIRIISEKNLLDDPLRALRAIRFSVTLDFAMNDFTSRMIKKHGRLLRQVSPERIKMEFARALASGHTAKFFRLLTFSDLIPVLFPQTLMGMAEDRQLWHPVFNLALPVSMELEGLLYAAEALLPGCASLLERETEKGVKRSSLLKLAAFITGLTGAFLEEGEKGGKAVYESAADFLGSLRFSTNTVKFVKDLMKTLEVTDSFIMCVDPSSLSMYRFCEEAGGVFPEAILLCLSLTMRHDPLRRHTASAVWEYYLQEYLPSKKAPLVTGRDVLERFGKVAGPEVGRYLKLIEEARARGEVRTKEEALEYVKSSDS